MRAPRSSELKIPFVFGAAPLTVGLSVFLLWLATGWKWLQLVGILTLCVGFVSVLAGLMCLGIWSLKKVRSREWSQERLMGETMFVAMVLVINFPVAGGIVWTVYNLEARYTLTIHASAAIHSAVISGGGVSLELGRIEPGASVTKRFHILHKGALKLSGEQSGRKVRMLVDAYVTNGGGGHKEIEVFADGKMEVSSEGG